jgi:hypothetical protein
MKLKQKKKRKTIYTLISNILTPKPVELQLTDLTGSVIIAHMKKIPILSILLLLVTASSLVSNLQAYNVSQGDDSQQLAVYPNSELSQTDAYRPLFVSVENNGEMVRERNDTLGLGAVYRAEDLYSNVTITYMVVNGNNETKIRLYADVPGNFSLDRSADMNKSLTFSHFNTSYFANYTVPYTSDFFDNATVSFYTVSLNITADYIEFYAAFESETGLSEDDVLGLRNLITRFQSWETKSQDEFYIQFEHINITLTVANATENDTYGIKYKDTTSSNWVEMNFTYTFSSSNVSAMLDLNDRDIGTEIEWISYAYLEDITLNLTRRIEGIDHQFVDVGDGTPILDVKMSSPHPDAVFYNDTLYSQTPSAEFNFSASVPKGNLTSFSLQTNAENISITPTINASLSGEYMNRSYTYPANGTYSVVFFAFTNKGLEVNMTFTIIIDKEIPTVKFLGDFQDGIEVIESTDGLVTFEFEFSDLISTVRYAILDLGDDTSVEVTHIATYTHKYLDFNRNYFVSLTIIDWAGNSDSVEATLTLNFDDVPDSSPPQLEFYLFLIGVIALILSPWYGSRLLARIERFRN